MVLFLFAGSGLSLPSSRNRAGLRQRLAFLHDSFAAALQQCAPLGSAFTSV